MPANLRAIGVLAHVVCVVDQLHCDPQNPVLNLLQNVVSVDKNVRLRGGFSSHDALRPFGVSRRYSRYGSIQPKPSMVSPAGRYSQPIHPS